jgi:hypothetical protein
MKLTTLARAFGVFLSATISCKTATCIFILSISLCFLDIKMFAQNSTIRFSSSNINGFSSSICYQSGKIWLMYSSGNTALAAGFFDDTLWHSFFSSKPPYGLYPNSFVEGTIDPKERIWFIYKDSLQITRVSNYFNGLWRYVFSPGSDQYGRYSLKNNIHNGVWVIFNDSTWFVADTIAPSRVIFPVHGRTVDIVSLPSDSLISIIYHFDGSSCDYSYWYSTKNNNLELLESGCGSQHFGVHTSPVTLGTDGTDVLAITAYQAISGVDSLHAYRVDTSSSRIWKIGLIIGDPGFGMRSTKRGPAIAILGEDGYTFFVKLFSNDRWYRTTSYQFPVPTPWFRTTPQLTFDADSMLWITYATSSNSIQRVFILQIRPDYSVDPLLTTVLDYQSLPSRFSLSQNYPNPFNPSTTIEFSLPHTEFVTLKVYDLLGQEVATLAAEQLSPGTYTRTWNAENSASGIYFYRLQTAQFTETKKLVLIK